MGVPERALAEAPGSSPARFSQPIRRVMDSQGKRPGSLPAREPKLERWRDAPRPDAPRVVIQIPCYDEADALPVTLAALPRELPGVGRVAWLVVDDGSTDGTPEVARRHGVDRVVELGEHRGLAAAFTRGIEAALSMGADVIVNTDADNQYAAADIEKLVRPVLAGEADIVIGARPIASIEHFSPLKKTLQRLGSWVVRLASGTEVPDAPSGFRAFSREAALRMNVFNDYSYTLETIIQAGQRGMSICSVPVRTNPELRPSRLMRSTASYVLRSTGIIARIFMIYQPRRFFFALGGLPIALGALLGARYLALLFAGTGRTHAPSLILAAICLLGGLALCIFGLVADLLAVNRRLLEELQLQLRRRALARREVRR
jgi:glycosyltransferase involved in cell wall biosynthesis